MSVGNLSRFIFACCQTCHILLPSMQLSANLIIWIHLDGGKNIVLPVMVPPLYGFGRIILEILILNTKTILLLDVPRYNRCHVIYFSIRLDNGFVPLLLS